jgi:sulfatase maturation enzyme AslB (radical SAM superfamily)
MHSDLFPVSQNVPEDLLVVKDQPSNINKHIYELSLSLFDRCNLKCSFCFQNPHRDSGIRDFDRDYILAIPENTVPYVLG